MIPQYQQRKVILSAVEPQDTHVLWLLPPTTIGNYPVLKIFMGDGWKEVGTQDYTLLATKVDKVEGKELSTNDYTDEDKETVTFIKVEESKIINLPADTTSAINAEAESRRLSDENLQTQIEALASGTPKGSYPTLADLEAAFPTGTIGIYVVTADGHWYYWDDVAEKWADGGAYQAALDVVGLLGVSETKVINQKAVTLQSIEAWSLSESFSISSPTFDSAGYILGGVITWPDGDVGSISNVTVGANGITSIRYNRSEAGKYATVNIAYDGSGVVSNQTVVLTGF